MTKSIWSYPADTSSPSDVLVGFAVEATDGHIGKVDEATIDTGRHSIVVDTGFWIFGKKRRIPAGMIERIDRLEETVFLRIMKSVVKAAPEYEGEGTDPNRIESYDEYYHPLM